MPSGVVDQGFEMFGPNLIDIGLPFLTIILHFVFVGSNLSTHTTNNR